MRARVSPLHPASHPHFRGTHTSRLVTLDSINAIFAVVFEKKKKVYTALKQTGLHDRVKMVTPLEMSILGASYPPSAGQVAHAHLEVVSQLVKLLVRIGKGLRVVLLPASFVWYWDRGFVAARPFSCVVSLWVLYNSLAVCRCNFFFMVRVSASRDDSIGCLHRTV